MNYIKLLMTPFEIVLLTFLCFVASILLATYFMLCIIVEIFRKGFSYGFRRNIT
jgi:hypothetical protein